MIKFEIIYMYLELREKTQINIKRKTSLETWTVFKNRKHEKDTKDTYIWQKKIMEQKIYREKLEEKRRKTEKKG